MCSIVRACDHSWHRLMTFKGCASFVQAPAGRPSTLLSAAPGTLTPAAGSTSLPRRLRTPKIAQARTGWVSTLHMPHQTRGNPGRPVVLPECGILAPASVVRVVVAMGGSKEGVGVQMHQS